MSADKRSVSTDAIATLGSIIDEKAGRDAIHLAVEPVVAGERLYPGQDIGFVDGKASTQAVKKLGIVDPFLKSFVPPGEMFWLIVYPRQITSLRHVWEHPEFGPRPGPPLTEVEQSERWLHEYCESTPWSYDTIMQRADENVKRDIDDDYPEYLCGGAEAEGAYLDPEFWKHYQIVRGVTVPEKLQQNFFTCSC